MALVSTVLQALRLDIQNLWVYLESLYSKVFELALFDVLLKLHSLRGLQNYVQALSIGFINLKIRLEFIDHEGLGSQNPRTLFRFILICLLQAHYANCR